MAVARPLANHPIPCVRARTRREDVSAAKANDAGHTPRPQVKTTQIRPAAVYLSYCEPML